MFDIARREAIYLWYHFTVHLERVFGWWVLGMVIGAAISVFAKGKLQRLCGSLSRLRLGGAGGDPGQSAGHCVAPVHVWCHPQNRRHLRLAGDAPGRLAGCLHDVLHPAQSPADPIQWRSWSRGPLGTNYLQLLDGTSMGSTAAFMLTEPSTEITNLGVLKTVLGLKPFGLLFGVCHGILLCDRDYSQRERLNTTKGRGLKSMAPIK